MATFGNPAIWLAGIPSVTTAVVAWPLHRRTGRWLHYRGTVPVPTLGHHPPTGVHLPLLFRCAVHDPLAGICHANGNEDLAARQVRICAYLVLAALLFILFYPLLSGLQVPESYIQKLRWFKRWLF